MRFERKYKIDHLSKSAVEQAVKLHAAGFQKIYPNRQVNNIYFDTPDYQTGRHNIEGVNQRKKFRLRWYGPDVQKIDAPRLEIKIKENELGRKEIFAFQDNQLDNLAEITEAANIQFSKYQYSHLQPTLLNTYQRSYWGTSCGKFRITVDWKLVYYTPMLKHTFFQTPIHQKSVILELKYDEAMDIRGKEIFKGLPFRQTKSSKYVMGILLNH